MKKQTILVTGATGFVGSYVVRELLAHGYRVRALARPTSDTSTLDDRIAQDVVQGDPEEGNFSLHRGDICDRDSLVLAAKGVQGIIHIAALFREAKHGDDVYRQVNIGGTENVLSVAEEVGARLVHCSTVGVHSHIPHPPADESEPYRPADIYQETKCEGEKLALEWFRSNRVSGVVIRPAMIWGPGDTRTLKLFRGVVKGTFPLIGWGKTYLHWISVVDLAIAFRLAYEKLALTDEVASGEVFIISGRAPVSIRELVRTIAEIGGGRVPRISIPALPVQLLGSLCEFICRPLGIEPPLYRRRVDFFTKTRSFSSEKANRLLGFQPRGDLADEIQEIFSWYWERGWIDRPEGGAHGEGKPVPSF